MASRTRTTLSAALSAALLVTSGVVLTVAAGPAGAAPVAMHDSGYDDSCSDEPATPPRHDDSDEAEDRDESSYRSDDDCKPEPPPAPEPEPQPQPQPQPESPPQPQAQPPAAPAPAPLVVVVPEKATIIDGNLDCGDVATEPADGEAPGVSLKRISDAQSTDPCTPVPYTLSTYDNHVQFLKSGSPYAQFIATVDWYSELETPSKTKTWVDFELVPGYEVLMSTCPAALYSGGSLVGLSNIESQTPESLAALGIVDQDGVDNGITQFACVGSRSGRFVPATPDSEPYYIVTEQLYLLGDVVWRG